MKRKTLAAIPGPTMTPEDLKKAVAETQTELLTLEYENIKADLRHDGLLTTPTTPAAVPREYRCDRSGHVPHYELRTATGWQTLPQDRAQWPAWIRESMELGEKIDAERRHSGRLVAARML